MNHRTRTYSVSRHAMRRFIERLTGRTVDNMPVYIDKHHHKIRSAILYMISKSVPHSPPTLKGDYKLRYKGFIFVISQNYYGEHIVTTCYHIKDVATIGRIYLNSFARTRKI